MSLDVCKRGFHGGSGPIIFLDGCLIKINFGGQMLCEVGMDPNDCFYHLANVVLEVEFLATWK